ncbi:YlzJ-like family protein [Candidatus Darwinibacter acetoxidans]
MLYTVLPLEEVLEGLEEDPPRTIQLAVGEITVEAEPLGSFQARVVRVLSTDPRHFLEPHCQPGSIIHGQIV